MTMRHHVQFYIMGGIGLLALGLVVSHVIVPSLMAAAPKLTPSSAKASIVRSPEPLLPLPDHPSALIPPLTDRRLSREERQASIAADLSDAALRIEGIHDPTRIGLFGAALRMMVRPATASMSSVFGDRWARADTDPNVHYRVHILRRFGSILVCAHAGLLKRSSVRQLGGLSDPDCQRLQRLRTADSDSLTGATIVAAPLSLPVFVSPYPGE